MDHISHIGKLNTIDPKLAQLLEIICTGEQKRLNIKSGNNLMNLDVHCQTIVIQGRELKIVTLQDIKNELDKHEMDSWQKLIRILNHEIMNSVAPITSLSSTLSGFYKSDGNEKTPDLITQKIISDTIRGLNIIEDHGKGLIKFVESYRSLTQLPKPEFKRVNVKELLERVLILANCNLDTYINGSVIRPSISTSVIPANLTLLADDKLLAQVFVNVIKNSVEAFDFNRNDNEIGINAFINPAGRITIKIKDNGPGIEAETLERIFIPFFTTKELGTGIGLSLSKQIMRLHNGNITCDSTPGSGSTFSLIF
jgi:signal transduction histidine kinase